MIVPGWPLADRVRAGVTERSDGLHALSGRLDCRDDRAALADRTGLQLAWLEQVHGTRVVRAEEACSARLQADAAWSTTPGIAAVVLTADCLPVLLADTKGTVVAAAHAGWRGLAAGVLQATVAALPCAPGELHAWLGPAISQSAFEVGPEVERAFTVQDAQAASFFRPGAGDRLHADLYGLARRALHGAGVANVHGGEWCTYSQAERFYSHRLNRSAGRMASFIAITH